MAARTADSCPGAAATSASQPASVSTAGRRAGRWVTVPAYPTLVLQAGPRVREPAGRDVVGRRAGSSAGAVGNLGEHREDLVVRVGMPASRCSWRPAPRPPGRPRAGTPATRAAPRCPASGRSRSARSGALVPRPLEFCMVLPLSDSRIRRILQSQVLSGTVLLNIQLSISRLPGSPTCRSPASTTPSSTSATSSAASRSTRGPRASGRSTGCDGLHGRGVPAGARLDERPRPRPVRDRRGGRRLAAPVARTVGLYHLAWEVDTLGELDRHRRQARPSAGALVGATDHGTTKALYAKDPDGLEFEVVLAGAGRPARPRDPRWPAAADRSRSTCRPRSSASAPTPAAASASRCPLPPDAFRPPPPKILWRRHTNTPG